MQKHKRVVYERKKKVSFTLLHLWSASLFIYVLYIINYRNLISILFWSKEKKTGIGTTWWGSEMQRAQVRNILKVEFTSSDEECEDGFITQLLLCQSNTFSKVESHHIWIYVLLKVNEWCSLGVLGQLRSVKSSPLLHAQRCFPGR